MKQQKMILRVLMLMLFLSLVPEIKAQQTNVDSIILLIKKSNTKVLDTITFNKAKQLLVTTVLTDDQISQIEKIAEQFKKGSDQDLYYYIKIFIIRSLTNYDKIRAINYGKLCLNILEKSSISNSNLIRNSILCELRFPYRNSTQIVEGFQYFTEKVKEY